MHYKIQGILECLMRRLPLLLWFCTVYVLGSQNNAHTRSRWTQKTGDRKCKEEYWLKVYMDDFNYLQ